MTVAVTYTGVEEALTVDVGPPGWPSLARFTPDGPHVLLADAQLPALYLIAPEEDWLVEATCMTCHGAGYDPTMAGLGDYPCVTCAGSGLA